MLQAVIETHGGIHRIECIGHATGSEQVCAAVSGLMTALAGYLVNHNEQNIKHITLESGNGVIMFKGAHAAFEMTKIGLLQIAQAYPKYFCVILKKSPKRG